MFLLDAFLAALTGEPGRATVIAVLAVIAVAEALWLRTFGIDLTPTHAVHRGARRVEIPWSEVSAVVPFQQFGMWRVQLERHGGTRLRRRAPTTWWGTGRARFDRDFHTIGQW